jgi:hypothetical protein
MGMRVSLGTVAHFPGVVDCCRSDNMMSSFTGLLEFANRAYDLS